MSKHRIVYSTHKIKPILESFTNSPSRKILALGFLLNTNSLRLQVFKEQLLVENKIFCVSCFKEATHFKLESHSQYTTPHFNLYSDDNTLFTKDHILPKSRGGLDPLSNLQVMCVVCNNKKGNHI